MSCVSQVLLSVLPPYVMSAVLGLFHRAVLSSQPVILEAVSRTAPPLHPKLFRESTFLRRGDPAEESLVFPQPCILTEFLGSSLPLPPSEKKQGVRLMRAAWPAVALRKFGL